MSEAKTETVAKGKAREVTYWPAEGVWKDASGKVLDDTDRESQVAPVFDSPGPADEGK